MFSRKNEYPPGKYPTGSDAKKTDIGCVCTGEPILAPADRRRNKVTELRRRLISYAYPNFCFCIYQLSYIKFLDFVVYGAVDVVGDAVDVAEGSVESCGEGRAAIGGSVVVVVVAVVGICAVREFQLKDCT